MTAAPGMAEDFLRETRAVNFAFDRPNPAR